jgi:hypothetical protein
MALGVSGEEVSKVQRKLHTVAAKYLASLVRLTRQLRARVRRRAPQH